MKDTWHGHHFMDEETEAQSSAQAHHAAGVCTQEVLSKIHRVQGAPSDGVDRVAAGSVSGGEGAPRPGRICWGRCCQTLSALTSSDVGHAPNQPVSSKLR